MADLPAWALKNPQNSRSISGVPTPSRSQRPSPGSRRLQHPTSPSHTIVQQSTATRRTHGTGTPRRCAVSPSRARECLQDHLLGIIRTTESDSGVKRVLSAMRVVEKFRWIAPVVMALKLVEAVAAYHDKRRGGSHLFWASM